MESFDKEYYKKKTINLITKNHSENKIHKKLMTIVLKLKSHERNIFINKLKRFEMCFPGLCISN